MLLWISYVISTNTTAGEAYQLQTSEIRAGFLMVYLSLLSLAAKAPEGKEYCERSLLGIARETGLTVTSVSDALTDLESRKWIGRIRHGPPATNSYHILHPPPAWRRAPGAIHPAVNWFLDQYRNFKWSRGSILVYLELLAQARVIPSVPPVCHQLVVQQISGETGLSRGAVQDAVADLQRRELVEVRPWRQLRLLKYGRYLGSQGANLYFIKNAPPGWQPYTIPDREVDPGLQRLIIRSYNTRVDPLVSCSAVTREQAQRAAERREAPPW